MTAIVAIKYDKGIIVKADSLAIRALPSGDGYAEIKELRRRQKVIPITKHVVMGISCNALGDESFRIFVMLMKANLAKMPIAVSMKELANDVKYNLEAMHKAQPDLYMGVLLAGYDKAADFSVSNPQLCRIELDGEVMIHEEGNYTAVGAKNITDHEIEKAKQQGLDIEKQFIDRELAMKGCDLLLEYCSAVDAAYVADGDSMGWHVGGQIKQWDLTPSGVQYVKGGKVLKILAKKGDMIKL
jgi:hypothetical protein